MKTIHVYLTIGYPTATHEDEIEVQDDATEEEIEQITQEWAQNYVEYGWSFEKPKARFR